MATARQIEVYRLHKDVCLGNGHAQKFYLHRAPEGVLSAVAGFPNNTDYQEPGPRSIEGPATNGPSGTPLWATWQPMIMRGGSGDAGDSEASRFWAGRMTIQFPAIDDSFNVIAMQDDDYISDDQGFRYNIENPMLSSDGAFWTAILDRVR
jgi:hypothetical protein